MMIIIRKLSVFIFMFSLFYSHITRASNLQEEVISQSFSGILTQELKTIEEFLDTPDNIDGFIQAYQLGYQADLLQAMANDFIHNNQPWDALKTLIWAIAKVHTDDVETINALKDALTTIIDNYLLTTTTQEEKQTRGKRGKRGGGNKNTFRTVTKTILNTNHPLPDDTNKQKILSKLQSLKQTSLHNQYEESPYFQTLKQEFSIFLSRNDFITLEQIISHQEASFLIAHNPLDTPPSTNTVIMPWAKKLGKFVDLGSQDLWCDLSIRLETSKNQCAIAYYYTLAAENEDAGAQGNLACMYERGIGVKQDYHLACKYYQLAADKGYVLAQFNLAVMYEQGIGVKQDDQLAFKYYKLSADQGYEDAQFTLACMYEKGTGVEKNDKKTLYYFKLSAKQGHVKAQYNTGVIYLEGRGTEPDPQEAFNYFKRAAEQNDANAQFDLACMYAKGTGEKQDDQLAFKYYKLSADQGYADAQFHLGILYLEGIGTERNPEEAFNYLKRAADQGDTTAQSNLGVMYLGGRGTERNPEEAFNYFKRAADQGYAIAQTNLALIYLEGRDTERNPEEAFNYFKRAAEQGDVKAQFNLACMYARGIGVEKNDQLAFEYYQLAADQEDVMAQCNLGVMYLGGRGTKRNPEEALFYFQRAADSDNAYACLCVAYMHSYILDSQLESQEYINKALELDATIKNTPIYSLLVKNIQETSLADTYSTSKSNSLSSSDESDKHSSSQDEFQITTSSSDIEIVTPDITMENRDINKITKKERKQEKRRKKIERLLQQPEFQHEQSTPYTIELEFESEEGKNAFYESQYYTNKIKPLLDDIARLPWGLRGSGQPEYLKGTNGLMSRRITREHRLVYKCIGELSQGTYKIKILSWHGHY
jgi:hypothetical protein